jgi:MerR family copper efflux transcriptional regulator
MTMLRIGQVAALSGVRVDTVRYYERLGLLPTASRRRSGYRVFDDSSVARIKLIKELQELGLSLEEIDAMGRALGDHDHGCSGGAETLKAALARTEAQLAALSSVREKLTLSLRRCGRGECTFVAQAELLRTKAPGEESP